jgi:hypothetical protein
MKLQCPLNYKMFNCLSNQDAAFGGKQLMSTNLHTRERERELRTEGEMRQPRDTQRESE